MSDGNTRQLEGRGKIFQTLIELNLVRPETVSVFSENTRDIKGLRVLRDEISGIIFIDGHYVGEQEYRSGVYREQSALSGQMFSLGYEDHADTERRVSQFQPFIVDKTVCDLGCGAGGFLRRIRTLAKDVVGIELQNDYREQLNMEGIRCVDKISRIDMEIDAFFLFHCFEHLLDPISILRDMREKLVGEGKGRIVIEVPHAKDFLIDKLALRDFIDFTLWSQHLILHTRESLSTFLRIAGFRDIVIAGVQRFSFANHIQWLKDGKPGGHKSILSVMEDETLRSAYADTLSRLDATDSLIAVATI